MTDYADTLAADSKALCIVWDFPDLQTRFVTRNHAGLTLPQGWTLFEGAEPLRDEGSSIDPVEAKLTSGAASFRIADENQAVTAWLAQNDGALYLTQVTRKQGFLDGVEANYQVSRWLFADYRGAEPAGGAYELQLTNVLRALENSLYEDFDGESYRLGADLGDAATTITLENSPKGKWREPGYCVLHNRDEQLYELVGYQTIGGTGNKDLQTCTRRVYGVGRSGYTWPQDDSQAIQVWIKRGNPLSIMLEWMLSTDTPGANGPYDTGADGLGAKVDQSYVDVAGIESLRDDYWPVPVFSGNALQSGTAVLFVEKDPIEDLGEWISKHILQPLGLFPIVKADERFSVETRFRVPPNTAQVGDEWMKEELKATEWSRGLDGSRINNLLLKTDFDLEDDDYALTSKKEDTLSSGSYGKAKAQEVEGRGQRTGRLGFPDYNGAANISVGASRIILDCGNPWSEIKAALFYKHKDLDLAQNIALNVPTTPNLATGSRGGDDRLYNLDRRRVDDSSGRIEVELRERRTLYRAAFIAPDDVADDYDSASQADKQYCYCTPNDDDVFPNGDPSYKVVD